MAIVHITPDNFRQFITSQGESFDPRQYLAGMSIDLLRNRNGVPRATAERVVRKMRGIADALDPSKPTAPKGLPPLPWGIENVAPLTPVEKAAEMQRLRTMADYIESRLVEFLA